MVLHGAAHPVTGASVDRRRACGQAGPSPLPIRHHAPMPAFREPPADSPRAGQPVPVIELLKRLVRERGLDFEPLPAGITDALPELVRMVDELAERFVDEQERRWLAAALAALSHHVQAGTLISPDPSPPSAAVAGIAVAVVTSPRGVLIGRRRDGIPRWVFPGGTIEDGETPCETAVRECAEEAGIQVLARHEIGRRPHPFTGCQITYVACSPVSDDEPWAAAPTELVEVRWVESGRIVQQIPDLCEAVREHLGLDTRPWPEP